MKLSNYLKFAIRNNKRRAGASLINLLGLSIGLAVTMLIALYIKHELQYDNFFENAENIYRTITHRTEKRGEIYHAATIFKVADVLNEEIPEIEKTTRIFRQYSEFIFSGESHYGKYSYHYVDSTFLDVFSYKILEGKPQAYLNQPDKVVLCASTAQDIFGKHSAIGKEVIIDEEPYEVIGVMEDVPAQSHLKFDFLVTLNSLSQNYLKRMGSDFYTYFSLNTPLTPQIEEKISQAAANCVNKMYENYGLNCDIQLQALTDIHLKSDFTCQIEDVGNRKYLYIFGSIGLFLLIIALFNYVNMSLATAEQRKREIAIRKASGAIQGDIKRQFLTESIFTSVLAFLLAMLWVESFITPFSQLIGSTLSLTYPEDIKWLVVFVAIAILLGVISGAYPAFYISRMQTQEILRPQTIGKKRFGLRNMMLAMQFVLSLALVATLFGFRAQLNYLLNAQPGYASENIVVFNGFNSLINKHYPAVRQECQTHTGIVSVVGSIHTPGCIASGMTLRRYDEPEEANRSCREYKITPGFIKTYGLEIIAGRDFSEERESDKNNFLINETAANMLGGDILGKKVHLWSYEGEVIGIVKDFHTKNLHHKIGPLAFSQYRTYISHLSVRFRQQQKQEVINHVTKVLQQIDPNYIPQYHFLEDTRIKQYKKEAESAKLISVGAILAIILSGIGLFSLTSYQLEQRTKEIGVRKVLGASGKQLNVMLLVYYLRYVLFASFIGLPLAFWILQTWFEDFAYHTHMDWRFFAGALALTFIIALVSIIVKTTRVTQLPPVYSLRDE